MLSVFHEGIVVPAERAREAIVNRGHSFAWGKGDRLPACIPLVIEINKSTSHGYRSTERRWNKQLIYDHAKEDRALAEGFSHAWFRHWCDQLNEKPNFHGSNGNSFM